MAKTNKAADLLKLLGQSAPSVTPPAKPITVPPPAKTRTPQSPSKAKPAGPQSAQERGVRGKAIQFYLHTPDEKLIREFAVWLSPHRKRINDSLVIKAVLRAAKTGPALLAAYDEGLSVSEAHKEAKKRSRSAESQ